MVLELLTCIQDFEKISDLITIQTVYRVAPESKSTIIFNFDKIRSTF